MRLTYIALLGLLVGTVLAVPLAATGWLYARHVQGESVAAVASAAATAQARLGGAGRASALDGPGAAGALERLARREGVELSVRRTDGSVLTTAEDPSRARAAVAAPPPGGEPRRLRSTPPPLLPPRGPCASARLALGGGGDGGGPALLVQRPCDAARDRVLTVWAGLAVLWPLGLGCSLLPAVLLHRRSAHDLRRVRRTLRAVADGAYHLRAEARFRGHDVNRLAEDVNRLAATVQSVAEEQHHVLADVAHQLRNPLIALRLRIETLAGVAPEAAGERHARLLADVDRLDRTLTDMLEHARGGRAQPSTQVVDVCAVVEECVRGWAAVAERRTIRLRLDRPRQAWALARTGALEQATDVLLDNALTYAPEGSDVHVGITLGTRLEIRVRDEGPGMTPAEREAALTRGWRGAEHSGGGSGIGLPIAAKLVASCGGRLELGGTPGEGLCATLYLAQAAPVQPGAGGEGGAEDDRDGRLGRPAGIGGLFT
ncbi:MULTISPECIES: sensor histidine kinase [unclassified Streptomyces]|uniref:sensor histidine kinase n=1 Tax=unclassified Streptomyces TaxID=2593676 RepID=UPI0022B73D14|nr:MULTISPECIES: HAMP domain-containing sensor histidine kinase [unclassified Streptomyces]MCZ7414362.1 HAMP domain-containing sensor histidine kinase [Streptomyces sp. WMMC897]MCZ7431317.1 HAMP domain-containing sensor histidine kinase [Streptomyces sp. WMMC1477]